MKKINGLFVMMFLLVGTLGFVVADETPLDKDQTGQADDAVPEPKKIGFFKNQMFKLNLAFTFNKERKIDKVLEMAERRLAEAELLAEEDPEAYVRAQERYDDLVARAEEILSKIGDGDGDENKSIGYMEKVARIQNKFERHRDHADEIYARALERFAANNASDEKIARFEMFHERALNRSDQMEARILEKRENAIRKHKALSEMSDSELEGLLVRIESGEGLAEARAVRMDRLEVRIQKLGDRGITMSNRMTERFENANLTEGQKARIGLRIDAVEGRIGELGDRVQLRFDEQKAIADKKAADLRAAIEAELKGRVDKNLTGAVACTMEAKECSDGSFVGRVGLDCAFALCPDELASTQ